MSYRIPPAKVLAESIYDVIRENQTVDSQRRFTELVLKALKKRDSEFTASELRIRKAAILKGPVKLHIHYRETGEISSKGKCPVCGSETALIKNKTLFEEKVALGFKCTRCPYWTGQQKQVPIRYIFNAIIEEAPKPPRKKVDDRYAQWKFA